MKICVSFDKLALLLCSDKKGNLSSDSTVESNVENNQQKDIIVSSLKSMCEKYCDFNNQHMPRSLKAACINLRKNSDIIITKPDKGNGVVLLDKSDYISLLKKASVDDSSKFREIDRNEPRRIGRPSKHYHPLLKKENDLCTLLDSTLPKKLSKELSPRGSRLAHLYGLPKTHKPTLSVRPILSATATYNYKLAQWLEKTLKPIASNSCMIRDTYEFIHELRNLKIGNNDILVSYDVTALFTSVPLDETINYLVDRAFENDWLNRTHTDLRLSKESLKALLEAATKNQLFVFEDKLYEQFEGVAMGSPLGPLMANSFMCMLEKRLSDSNALPSYYRRYVDDTIAVFSSHEDHIKFFDTINTLHPSIKFTAELAKDNILPFIGVNISKANEVLHTAVHHKHTDSGLLLHFHSHTDIKYKRALLRTMITRAYRLSSSWHALHEECSHIHRVFTALRYPTGLIEHTISDVISSHRQTAETISQPQSLSEPARFVLPFKSQKACQQLRSDVQTLNKRFSLSIQPVFTSTKLKDMITPAVKKEPIISRSCVVYQYTCTCEKRYVGFTAGHLHDRISGHRRSSSAIHRHCSSSSHQFDENRFSVITKCASKFECRVRESQEIYFRKPELNNKDEYCFSLLYRFRK